MKSTVKVQQTATVRVRRRCNCNAGWEKENQLTRTSVLGNISVEWKHFGDYYTLVWTYIMSLCTV